MSTGELPTAPIWDDIRTLRREFCPPTDIFYGGFPCQNVSVAGLRGGLGKEQSGLFFEIIRLAEEIKPAFIFLENVPGIRQWLSFVGTALADIGYDCRWDIISAKEIGAPFEGKRWFALAKANGNELRIQSGRGARKNRKKKIPPRDALEIGKTPAAISERLEEARIKELGETPKSEPWRLLAGNDWDEHARELLRVDDGVPYRAHRIRALGNAVVSIQAKTAFERLMGL